MVLGSAQPLTEIITNYISRGVKAAGEHSWQPYHVPIISKVWHLNLLEN
jgi:hypothetical protein